MPCAVRVLLMWKQYCQPAAHAALCCESRVDLARKPVLFRIYTCAVAGVSTTFNSQHVCWSCGIKSECLEIGDRSLGKQYQSRMAGRFRELAATALNRHRVVSHVA